MTKLQHKSLEEAMVEAITYDFQTALKISDKVFTDKLNKFMKNSSQSVKASVISNFFKEKFFPSVERMQELVLKNQQVIDYATSKVTLG